MTRSSIKVDTAGKKFAKSLKRSMLYGMTDVMMSTIGIQSDSAKLRQGEFWALKDIDFEVKQGETLGIIGPNGSGKSTLLKMLNGIYMPDQGRIEMNGRVGALIEVGAGFHPMLSGRENIYINGAILGMSKKEIDEKFDDIVAFADIGDFIDAPVKHYSSGMYVRLGFAIAINVNPEILLIDEILSVGDLSFQNKSLRKLAELRDKTHAVVFVSHNLKHVGNICDRVIILSQGKQVYYGETKKALIKYQDISRKYSLEKVINTYTRGLEARISSHDEIEYLDSGILDDKGQKVNTLVSGKPLEQFCDFMLNKEIEALYFSMGILDEQRRICLWSVSNDDQNVRFRDLKKGKYRIIIRYDDPHLVPGIYIPNVSIRNDITGEVYERILPRDCFEITGNVISRGVVNAEKEWELQCL